MRAEAAELLPELHAKAQNALPIEIMGSLVKNAPPFGIHSKSDDEYAAIFTAYLDALADLPLIAIEDAFLRWNRCELYPKDPGRHGFFPKPAEIHKLAEPKAIELRKAAYRAKRALEQPEVTARTLSPSERREARTVAIAAGVLDTAGRGVMPATRNPEPPERPSGSRAQFAAAIRRRADEIDEALG